jgi:transcriptional regulator with XRE-family HTH domain
VNAALLLIEARRRSGLSRRELARRGHTSASTLSAYESGASNPSVATLARLLRAAGFTAEISLLPVQDDDQQDRTERIEALFAFTDILPRGERGPLTFPVFRTPRATAR